MTKNNHNIPEDYNKTVVAHKNAEKPTVLMGDPSSKKSKAPTVKRVHVSKKSLKSSTVLVTLLALLVIGTVATYLYSQKDKSQEATILENPVLVADSPTTYELELAKNLRTDTGEISSVNQDLKTITINSNDQQIQYFFDESTEVYLGESSEVISIDSVKLNSLVTVEYDKSKKTLINLWVYNE